ncbi:MAG: hypothetical protein IJD08_04295 [Oscillospiraceae bacterium]|nr:hypothetical protein [Oscillospiraceae bacterium]
MDRLSAASASAIVVAAASAVIIAVVIVAAAAEKKNKDNDPPAAVVVSEHEISPRNLYLYGQKLFLFSAGMLYIMKTLERWLQSFLLFTGVMNGGLYEQKRI